MHICPKCFTYNSELENCPVCKLREDLELVVKKLRKKENRIKHKQKFNSKSYFDYEDGMSLD